MPDLTRLVEDTFAAFERYLLAEMRALQAQARIVEARAEGLADKRG